MTLAIAPASSGGLEFPYEEDDDEREVPLATGGPSPPNDGFVLVDNVPSTYGLFSDDSENENLNARKDDSTATTSTLPSLNDIDDEHDGDDFFVSKMQTDSETGNESEERLEQQVMVMEDETQHDASSDINRDESSSVRDNNARASNRLVRCSRTYGGLMNLGNTCYLNSALQMLASIDSFAKAIGENKPQVDESKLRNLLLDVLQRLNRGETVRPSDFKQELDIRSPLFCGFHQEDSHEFLTTILDLIDEDYKKKDSKMEIDKEQESSSQAGHNELPRAQHENAHQPEEAPNSPLKKQKVEVQLDDLPSIPASGSFIDLQFADIENLLHGTTTNSDGGWIAPSQEPNERPGPKCKLVGGRMDTAGIPLNRYEGHSLADEPANAIKVMNDENDGSNQTEERNPIGDILTTEVRVSLTCESCKYCRSHTETYFHLSLEIGSHCCSVEEGLRKFFAPERRELKCEKCFFETAMQTTEITRLPSVILLHLKRFIVDVSPDYTAVSYRKNQSAVSFDSKLGFEKDGVLHEFLAPDVALPRGDFYGIRSVVNHIGSSASCGHYTADANRWKGENREWIRFNDSFVSKVTEQDAVQDSRQTAYMIMYEVENTSSIQDMGSSSPLGGDDNRLTSL